MESFSPYSKFNISCISLTTFLNRPCETLPKNIFPNPTSFSKIKFHDTLRPPGGGGRGNEGGRLPAKVKASTGAATDLIFFLRKCFMGIFRMGGVGEIWKCRQKNGGWEGAAPKVRLGPNSDASPRKRFAKENAGAELAVRFSISCGKRTFKRLPLPTRFEGGDSRQTGKGEKSFSAFAGGIFGG
ncbi:MAG: hypothetical protein DBX55_07365 [Verrucomicrobia bacterium]|nr:MAG: hypothetical protein DBX55_07365 [Verrucomicrobiota bacterium]